MVDPGSMIASLGGAVGGVGSKLMFYFGYFLVFLLVGGVLFFLWVILQYKYKIEVFEMHGSSAAKDGSIPITKSWRDLAKETKDKAGVWSWQTFMTRKKIVPPPSDFIVPNNRAKFLRVNQTTFMPVKMAISNPSVVYAALPTDIKFMEQLEIQQAAQEYDSRSAWQMYMPLALMAGTILFCLILVGVVSYFTLGHAEAAVNKVAEVSDALRSSVVIPGAPQ